MINDVSILHVIIFAKNERIIFLRGIMFRVLFDRFIHEYSQAINNSKKWLVTQHHIIFIWHNYRNIWTTWRYRKSKCVVSINLRSCWRGLQGFNYFIILLGAEIIVYIVNRIMWNRTVFYCFWIILIQFLVHICYSLAQWTQ